MSKDEESAPPSLDSVMHRLDALKHTRKQDSQPIAPPGDAARAAIDFASASAVGCVLGYGLDYWLGTTPWGLIGGLIIGCLAGFRLLMAAEARANKARAEAENTVTNEPQE